MNIKRSLRHLFCVVLTTMAANSFAQQATETPIQLLDHLAGHWVLSGVMDGKQTTHEVDAEWVLNREYVRLHEVSHAKKANGDPAYEAIIFVGWEDKKQQYAAVWLDNTEGGGLSGPVAHARREEHAIPFVFVLSGGELHTTFTYDKASDTWNWTIDDVKNGKADRFADVRLTRRR